MRQRGYTLLEIVVTLAVFGTFLFIIVLLTADMRANEKRYPINYMAHPEVSSVMARLRKDIFDTKYYPATFQTYQQTPKTLILYTLQQTGFAETVIYDFRTAGEAHRKSFNATQQTGDWVARGVPQFSIGSFTLNTGQDAVRISATDEQNRLAIDEIFVPRPHD
ncbi:MAG: prepilin-type N-terminal cleavage/methylation domain-containing protein [Acidobacteriota bacterium]|nr:prepilin-type N-terminal cleavage/methylation domain-containing protein [Acidobacteriota bacterium]